MNLDNFKSTRVKLTFLYIGLFAILLFVFNIISIYAERQSFARLNAFLSNKDSRPYLTTFLDSSFKDFDRNFINVLLVSDFILVLVTSIASYFLSGVTLKPIQQMFEDQEKFSSDVSHELRTPLSNILLDLETLKKSSATVVVEHSLNIKAETLKMKKIIDGLLMLVRPNILSTKGELFDLSSVVAQASVDLTKLASQKNISVEPTIQRNIEIFGFDNLISQLILILGENAIKFSSEDSKISMSLRIVGKEIHLIIADNGLGIPKNDMSKIFDRYFTSGGSGLGLGLSIAKKIVQVHKAKIFVTSNTPSGSVFTVIFHS